VLYAGVKGGRTVALQFPSKRFINELETTPSGRMWGKCRNAFEHITEYSYRISKMQYKHLTFLFFGYKRGAYANVKGP